MADYHLPPIQHRTIIRLRHIVLELNLFDESKFNYGDGLLNFNYGDGLLNFPGNLSIFGEVQW